MRHLLFLLLVACPSAPRISADAPTKLGSATRAGASLRTADGRLSLVFPAGAVLEDTEISVTPYEDEQVVRGYAFEPDGIEFLQPVELRIQIDGSTEGLVLAKLLDDGTVLQHETRVEGDTLVAPIHGFSRHGVVQSPPMALALNLTAEVLPDRTVDLRWGCGTNSVCDTIVWHVERKTCAKWVLAVDPVPAHCEAGQEGAWQQVRADRAGTTLRDNLPDTAGYNRYQVRAATLGAFGPVATASVFFLAKETPTPSTTTTTVSVTQVTSSTITIAWTPVQNVFQYRVQRRPPLGNWGDLATVDAGTLTYTASTLFSASTYGFRVVSELVDTNTVSNEVEATTTSQACNTLGASFYQLQAPGTFGPNVTVSGKSQAYGTVKVDKTGHATESIRVRIVAPSTGWPDNFDPYPQMQQWESGQATSDPVVYPPDQDAANPTYPSFTMKWFELPGGIALPWQANLVMHIELADDPAIFCDTTFKLVLTAN